MRKLFLVLLFVWTTMIMLFLMFNAAKSEVYKYKILRIIDGDTVEIEAPYLPPPLKPSLYLRIDGVDTPEKPPRAQCPREDMISLMAKLYTEQEIANASDVRIVLRKWDKYGGRVLGDVLLNGIPLSQKLIDSGYAMEYHGGRKKSWCPKGKHW